MQSSNQSSQDVFSWDRLCNLLDDKLKDVTRKSDLEPLKADIKELREENVKLKQDIKKLTARLEFIDRKSRSTNVMVAGLNSRNITAAKMEFAKVCSESLKENINIISARMLSGGKSFCFNLDSSYQARNVIAAKKKLIGLNIYINRDYTEDEQNVRYNLRQLSKNISKNNRSAKVRLGEFCIFINNIKYTWSNGKIMANTVTDADFLKNLLAECDCAMEIIARDDQQVGGEAIIISSQ